MNIAVFCGSSIGADKSYGEAARLVGELFVERGIALVYGGASGGLMGVLADSVLRGGGEVVGVMPGHIVEQERAHEGLTRLVHVRTMHERKAKMSELADAFIVLPGGSGTLDEFFDVWTLAQLGRHDKPIAVLNVLGYYDALFGFLSSMVSEGFLSKSSLEEIRISDDARRIVESLIQ